MKAAPSHVDGFDLRGRFGFDGLKIAIAYQEVIFDDPAKSADRQSDVGQMYIVFIAQVEDQPVFRNSELQAKGAIATFAKLKIIVFQQIEDGYLSLMLNLGERRMTDFSSRWMVEM